MSRIPYPFAAIVESSEIRRALLLAAVDPRLSILLRGDKGAGKSTAARAIASLLPSPSPFVNLPLGATEDRLLGGLDLGRTLRGDPALKPGLLAEANGGVVYVDEINLLPDHLADSLLDVASGGIMFLEREGFSAAHECQFLLLGSMNPEEGTLRPQLLDRFALVVDVHASTEPRQRRTIVERRLRYEASPSRFQDEWEAEQTQLREAVAAARMRGPKVNCPPEILDWIAATVCEHNVRSLRADLALVRAGVALASLESATVVTKEHVESVAPLVLRHRAKQTPPGTHLPSPPPPLAPASGSETEAWDRIFHSIPVNAPRLAAVHPRVVEANPRGALVGSKRSDAPLELDIRTSVLHAVVRTGTPVPDSEDLHTRSREPRACTRFLFVVDSSGSQGVGLRMRMVKGAVAGLLNASSGRRDEVCVIAFRGASAEVVMEPSHESEHALRALEYWPTGGRTPLASGLELALQYVTGSTVMIVLTDGRANVPASGTDAWADAVQTARSVRCAALVVDTETGPGATGRPVELARIMNARHIRLDALHTEQQLILELESFR